MIQPTSVFYYFLIFFFLPVFFLTAFGCTVCFQTILKNAHILSYTINITGIFDIYINNFLFLETLLAICI